MCLTMSKIQTMSLVMGAILGFSFSSFVQMLWVPPVAESNVDRKLSAPFDNHNAEETTIVPGWREVHVYVGDGCTNGSTVFNRTKQFPSQFGQDRKVIDLFGGKPDGYYVDLAANDAHALSNTFALEKYHNWTGLCIEPNDRYWKSHIYWRKCTIVGALIGEKLNEEVPVAFRGFNGGIVDERTDNKRGGTDFRKTTTFLRYSKSLTSQKPLITCR